MAMGLLAVSSATPWLNPTKAHLYPILAVYGIAPIFAFDHVSCADLVRGTSSKSAEKSFVGQRRFEDKALPGTYWKDVPELRYLQENFLKVAEHCGMMVPDAVGSHGHSNIIRSCLCPIPKGKSCIDVEVFDDGF